MSKTSTSNSVRRSVRVHASGSREPIKTRPIVQRARAADADNPPLTPARVAKLKRVPRVKTLRRALGLTQEAFAVRYAIPLGTLRDWEQGRSEPDKPARAYLLVIANDPDGIARSLDEARA